MVEWAWRVQINEKFMSVIRVFDSSPTEADLIQEMWS